MRGFEPSQFSAPRPSSAEGSHSYGFWQTLIVPAISVAGGLTSTAIGASSAKRAQAAQYEHERTLAREQADLARLQLSAAQTEAAALRASSSLRSGGTTTTLLVVGGVVAAVGMIALAIRMRSRAEPPEEYGE